MRKSTLRRIAKLSATLLAAAVVASGPASAFELFGFKIFGGDETETEDVIGEPQNYSVEFAVTGPDEDLQKTLQGASTLWKDREKPASGVGGLLAKARGDYKRLLATLYGQGRYGGTISILIDGQEAADLPPDATLPNPASVAVSIDTGPLFHFREAGIVNQAPPATERRDEVALPEDEGYRVGEVARSGAVLKAERLSVEAWREQGFAKAKIAERRVEAAHDQDVIDANITVEPGEMAYYGPVSVTGTEYMDAEFVAYMTGTASRRRVRPGRSGARQQAAVPAGGVSLAAHRGGRRARPGRPPADQRHRAGTPAAPFRHRRDAIRRWMAPASKPTGCIATCSAAPSGCASTQRSPASARRSIRLN